MRGRFQHYLQSPLCGFLAAAVLSMLIYAFYGFSGWLYRDDAIYLYAGQQFAEGIPPYESIFDHKTPLSPILSGICVAFGRAIQVDDVLAVRYGWWLMSGLTGGFLFLLGRKLYQSSLAGLLAATALTGFWSFGREAVSGPRAKSPFVLFEVMFFFFAARRNWGLAGMAAALATWVWQPGIVYVMVACLIPLIIEEGPWRNRFAHSGKAAFGVLLPSGILFGYFIWKGAFAALIEGSILFNLIYLDRPPFDLLAQLMAPFTSLFKGYSLMAVPGLAGLLYLALRGHFVFHNPGSRRSEWPLWAPMLIPLPLAALWTFMDFQGAADLYPFLPYMAIGIAGLLCWLIKYACAFVNLPLVSPSGVSWAILCVMAYSAASTYHATREDGLVAQRVSARQVAERFPEPGAIASVGLPELLVLTGSRNPNSYAFIIAGIDEKILMEWPNSTGIEGFAGSFAENGVEAIGIGPTEGRHRDHLFGLLGQNYKKERFGYFDVYVGTKVADKASDTREN